MTHRPKIEQIAPRDPNMALVAELAGIMSDIANMQVRVSRLFKHLSTTSIILPAPSEGGVADEIRNPQCPSNRAASADGKASSGAVPQDEAPQAGTGSEMLADREGHSAKGAGEDVASAAESRSNPAPSTRPTQKDRILELHEATILSPKEISEKTGIKYSSVSAHLSMARKARDERALRGDAARAALLTSKPQPEKPELKKSDPDGTFAAAVALTAQESRRPVAPRSKSSTNEAPTRFRPPSAPPIKAEAPKPIMMPVAPAKPTVDIDPDVIMVVDEANLQIHGALGTLNVSRPLARSLSRLQDGHLYDNKLLQAVGEWPSENSMKDHFRVMRSKLAGIGVDLFEVKNFGFKTRRLEGSHV